MHLYVSIEREIIHIDTRRLTYMYIICLQLPGCQNYASVLQTKMSANEGTPFKPSHISVIYIMTDWCYTYPSEKH